MMHGRFRALATTLAVGGLLGVASGASAQAAAAVVRPDSAPSCPVGYVCLYQDSRDFYCWYVDITEHGAGHLMPPGEYINVTSQENDTASSVYFAYYNASTGAYYC